MSQQLGPEARALLARARHSSEPSLTDRWTVRRNLAARLGAASAAVTTGVATSKAGATLLGSVKLSLLTQFGLATVAGATLATSAMLAQVYVPQFRALHIPAAASTRIASPSIAAQRKPTPTASAAPLVASESERNTTHVSATSIPRGDAPPRIRAPQLLGSAVGSRSKASTLHPTGPREVAQADANPARVAGGGLLDEGRALVQVQSALNEHRGADALQLLERQSQQYVGGALRPERAAARVIALCDVGRRVEARSAAERFAQAWPDSPLLGRVLETCK